MIVETISVAGLATKYILKRSYNMSVKRVLTGIRPTGSLHLGHYVGALKQWIEIQQSGEYECFFLVADIQALTTHADNPDLLPKSVREVVLDWLSMGLDPALPNVHFVLQSQVEGRADLSSLFTMIAKYSEVIRNPTLKTEMEMQKNATVGFMNYPVDQVADIYMVNPIPTRKGDKVLVPVGTDQFHHLYKMLVWMIATTRLYWLSSTKFSSVFISPYRLSSVQLAVILAVTETYAVMYKCDL
jgi:tryptophanyl-tRNA synthetase